MDSLKIKLENYYKSVGADKFGNIKSGEKASKPSFAERPKMLPMPTKVLR